MCSTFENFKSFDEFWWNACELAFLIVKQSAEIFGVYRYPKIATHYIIKITFRQNGFDFPGILNILLPTVTQEVDKNLKVSWTAEENH